MNEVLELGKDLLTAEQIADEQIFLQLCEQYRIKASNEYDEHDWLLYRDGIGFSPRGNIMIIAAEKKAGKSGGGLLSRAEKVAYAEELDRNSPRNKKSSYDEDETTVVGTLRF